MSYGCCYRDDVSPARWPTVGGGQSTRTVYSSQISLKRTSKENACKQCGSRGTLHAPPFTAHHHMTYIFFFKKKRKKNLFPTITNSALFLTLQGFFTIEIPSCNVYVSRILVSELIFFLPPHYRGTLFSSFHAQFLFSPSHDRFLWMTTYTHKHTYNFEVASHHSCTLHFITWRVMENSVLFCSIIPMWRKEGGKYQVEDRDRGGGT